MKALNTFFKHLRGLLLFASLLIATESARSQTPDGNLALTITSPTTDTYRLTWFGQSGKKFQVQSSPDLLTWSSTGPVITGAEGTITVDDGPISVLQKFYRIGILGAIRLLPTTGQLERSDDGWSHDGELLYHGEAGYSPHANPATVPIGFTAKFFGVNYAALYINNNGNVTFDQHLQSFEPLPLQNLDRIIIAPYWADVDTRPTDFGQTIYSSGALVNGRRCFAITWPNVGYYSAHTDKLNRVQLVLIEREDVAAGDFDIEFNYDKLEWESGDANPPSSGGLGGPSARVGLSNGTTQSIELAGSGVNGSLLDTALTTGLIYGSRNSSVLGRYLFQVRSGNVLGAITIDAGPDQTLSSGVRTTVMAASASDPSGPLTYQWTKLSGFGTVTFSNPNALNPTVTFPDADDYVLQLTVTSTIDPIRTGADTVVIHTQ